MIQWESVSHHTEQFRNSADFALWRAAVGKCFAGTPKVQHTQTVVG
jgi:quinol monooxygenase YgiN